MRVAVHLPADHPESGGQESVCAYRLGRVVDGLHNAAVGYEPVPVEDLARKIAEEAQAEYPTAVVKIERLVDNGDGTSRWVAEDEFDVAAHKLVGGGEFKTTELSTTTAQNGG